jgi:hypothetical protein
MGLRVSVDEFRGLPLEAHAILAGVPLRDVSAIDLPGGGEGRTIADVRALLAGSWQGGAGGLAAALFALRTWIGRRLGWDDVRHDRPGASYLSYVPPSVRERSVIAPGSPDGPFRALYALDGESLSEIRNATVHAFLCAALVPRAASYRMYWAVYVQPVSRWTTIYMALIEPFRRFVVYPSLFAQIAKRWRHRYTAT